MTDVRYAIYIDAKTADAELARLHKSAVSAAGSEKMLAEATTTATTALKANAAATATAAKANETLQQRVSKLPDVLGKQAAAISLVSSSLADGNGAVGKAVAGAGQMAAAYGAGGPWALALVGGLALVGQFTQYLDKLNDEQVRAIDLQYASVDALSARKASLSKEVASLAAQSDPKSAKKAELAAIEAEISVATEAAAKAKASIYATTVEERQARLNEDATAFNIRNTEATQAQEIVDLLLKKYELTLKTNEAAAAGTTTPRSLAAPKDDADTRAKMLAENSELMVQQILKNQDEFDAIAADADAREQARVDAQAEIIVDKTRALAQARLEIQQKYLDDGLQAAIDDGKRQVAERKALLDGLSQGAMQAVNIVSVASGRLVADLVSGQEKALETFGVSIMAQAGQALVSYGTQALGAAALSLSVGNLPGAALQAATGAGLIAGGTALGGVAASIGAGFKQSEKNTAGSMTTPRSSSSSGPQGGGGTSYTIIYSPTRDQAASAVAVAGTTADARGFNRTKVR